MHKITSEKRIPAAIPSLSRGEPAAANRLHASTTLSHVTPDETYDVLG
jgi:hypothetical protein